MLSSVMNMCKIYVLFILSRAWNKENNWSTQQDLNLRTSARQSGAQTTELQETRGKLSHQILGSCMTCVLYTSNLFVFPFPKHQISNVKNMLSILEFWKQNNLNEMNTLPDYQYICLAS